MKRRDLLRVGLQGALLVGPLSAFLLSTDDALADAQVVRLIRRAEEVMRGDTSAAVMSMKIKTKSFERSYEMVSWSDQRSTDRSLIKILGPASFRGFGTLKIGNQLKLYDPKTNHVQVVGQSLLGSSWMGSHFSNDDLVKETRLAEDYTLKLVSKKQGNTDYGPATFYKVSLFPKPTAPVAWGRIDYEVWDNKKATVPISAKYFKRRADKNAARTMTFSGVKKMAGRVVTSEMRMTVADKPGEFTKITYRKLKIDVNIPASKFTESELRR